MKKILTIFIFGSMLAFSACSSGDNGARELINKSIYADLQSIEYSNRKIKSNEPILLNNAIQSGKYDVLGIPTRDQNFPFIWVVLNTNDGANGALSVPDKAKFSISCRYVERIIAQESIDAAVKIFLKKNCI